MGGAHGLMGLMNMMLQACDLAPKLQEDTKLMEVLKKTMDMMLKH